MPKWALRDASLAAEKAEKKSKHEEEEEELEGEEDGLNPQQVRSKRRRALRAVLSPAPLLLEAVRLCLHALPKGRSVTSALALLGGLSLDCCP
jgi:hypothetical protein